MKILGVTWFSTLHDTIGIVLAETEFSEERAYILSCTGKNEIADIKSIIGLGTQFPVHIARQLISENGKIFYDLYI